MKSPGVFGIKKEDNMKRKGLNYMALDFVLFYSYVPLFLKELSFLISRQKHFLSFISSGTSRTVYINFLSLFRGSGRHLSLPSSVHIDNLYGGVRC
jgi:hypothetical protein